jgi:site-specific recombinase XerD
MYLTFISRSESVNKDVVNIYCKITIDRFVSEFMLPIKGTPAWRTNYKILHYIESIKKIIEDIHLEMLSKQIQPTSEMIKREYIAHRDKKPLSLLSVYDEFVKKKITPKAKLGELAKSTTVKFTYTRNHLVSFIDINYKLADIPVTNVNRDFVENLEVYLRGFCHHNATMKHMQKVKRIIEWAVEDKGYLPKNPFNSVDLSQKDVAVIFLTQEELMRIMQKDMIPRLSNVREIFLFECFTGLAYADIKALRPEHCDFTSRTIIKPRQKTGTPSVVYMYDWVEMILRKYNCVLPIISNQRLNGYLKEIAAICNIDKTITTHVARHTYATTILLQEGVTLQTISRSLGHSSLQMTTRYAQLQTKAVVESGKNNEKNLEKYFTQKSLNPTE